MLCWWQVPSFRGVVAPHLLPSLPPSSAHVVSQRRFRCHTGPDDYFVVLPLSTSKNGYNTMSTVGSSNVTGTALCDLGWSS